MRLAIITGCFPAISETFILRQITGLIDLGHDVVIFSQNRPKRNDPTHADVAKYNLLSKTIYLDIPNTVKGRISGAPGLMWRTFGRKLKLALTVLNPLEYGRTAITLSALYRLDGLSSKNAESFDMVHCHFGFTGKDFRFVKNIWNCPLVVSFHGTDCSQTIKLNGPRTYARLFEEADGITVTGSYMKDRLMELGCPRQKIYILHCGINIDDYSLKITPWNRQETLKILSVGRLVEKKGLRYAIEGVARVRKVYSNFSYEIIGEGPLRPALENLIHDLKLEDVIQLKGALDSSAVRQALSDAHIYMLPSITADNGDQEGVPVSLMEASSCGLPVLSTLHSGIPEAVLDGKSGYLVAERDTDALAQRLLYLIENPEIWPKLGHAGRRHIERDYNILVQNNILVNIYKDVLEKRRII